MRMARSRYRISLAARLAFSLCGHFLFSQNISCTLFNSLTLSRCRVSFLCAVSFTNPRPVLLQTVAAMNVDAVYCSPLTRAMQTACLAFAELPGIPIVRCPAISARTWPECSRSHQPQRLVTAADLLLPPPTLAWCRSAIHSARSSGLRTPRTREGRWRACWAMNGCDRFRGLRT